jgi:hypothetical protein
MKMVVHQAVGVNLPIRLGAGLAPLRPLYDPFMQALEEHEDVHRVWAAVK